MTRTTSNPRPIVQPEFARRLNRAMDDHPLVPPLNFGRYNWLQDQLKAEGIDASTETIRRWCAGETKPKPIKMKVVARLLKVDEAWLALGLQPDMDQGEKKVRNALASGVVNVVAGLIQMAGGHPAFPEGNDKRADRVDIYAIIKGAQYSIKVATAREAAEGQFTFVIPATYEDLFVIGFVPGPQLSFDLIELPLEAIDENKVRKSGQFELAVERKKAGYVVGKTVLKQITSFAERL